jgi:hypothetical protein
MFPRYRLPATARSSQTLQATGCVYRDNRNFGGRGGIRTHGPFRAYSFQDCRNRPLYHSSINFGTPARSRTGRYSNTPFERAAFTYLATGAFLEQRVGFEPTVLEFCRLLHWASLPPLHISFNCFYFGLFT